MAKVPGAIKGTCYSCKAKVPKTRKWCCDDCRKHYRLTRFFTVRPVEDKK